jgi:hypothetical protein
MQAADIYQLFGSNRDLIASTWHFFVSVHMGLFAVLLLTPHKGGRRPELLFLIPFYLGFLYLNYRAQIDNYKLSNRLLSSIESYETGPATQRLVSQLFEPGWVLPYLWPIYLATAVFALALMIWSAFRKGAHKESDVVSRG